MVFVVAAFAPVRTACGFDPVEPVGLVAEADSIASETVLVPAAVQTSDSSAYTVATVAFGLEPD